MHEDPTGLPVFGGAVEQILRREMQPAETWRTSKVVGPIFTTTTSQIYQAFTGADKTPVAVKCTSPDDAREQYQALKKAAEILAADLHFKSPEPIALLKDSGIVVMSWIDAPSLQHMCLDRKTSIATIHEGLEKCGQMLGRLHSQTSIRENVLDTADFLHDIELAFSGIRPPKAIEPTLALLHESAAEIHQLSLPVATLHGDFKPANLLLAPSTTWTIDAALKWEGATVHDCAHFLNQFALDLYHPRGARLHPQLNALEKIFLEAYEHAAEPVSWQALDWLRLQKLVILYANQLNRKHGRLASMYLKMCIKREVKRAMNKFVF